MISMEEAVNTAFDHFSKLYKSAPVLDPLLEELSMTDDKKYWDVTIGFNAIQTEPLTAIDELMKTVRGPFGPIEKKKLSRKYKLFRINSESGEMASMQIKDVWNSES